MVRHSGKIAIVVALACALAVGLIAGEVTRRVALARFEARAMADARLRQALMASEIARFRLLPRVLADDRDVVAAVVRPEPGAVQRLNLKLEVLARELGAPVIYVIARDGTTLGASNWRQPNSFVGQAYGFRPYFRDALRHGAGEQFALGSVSRKPGLYLATRTPHDGVVVVKLEFDLIESQWRDAEGITYVTDRNGVILVSSRPRWRFAATRPLSERVRRAEEQTSGVSAIARVPYRVSAPREIVPDLDSRPYLVSTTAPDAAGWQVNLALPLQPTVSSAVRMAQAGAGLIALVLLGTAVILVERARQRRTRTAQLEAAVAERTAALRSEIAERASAEARAAQLREGLRQANRLATLGQVTASVAHETAQPVAAIRSYAATSALLLDRGDAEGVRTNLAAIARLADRIGAVTAHLRGFARKGAGGAGAVPLDAVIEGARLILKEKLSAIDFRVDCAEPGLLVRGERVRLEQVVVNLIQNAAEAVAEVADPLIRLTIAADPREVRLRLQDNGPGIDAGIAPQLFMPFVTSRPSGLGLGLVIARDIVEEFGGTLAALPPADGPGGACFEIMLVRAS
ncbi:ATP-binding protein [Novosphingobium sp.]|uniref:sensor histidine kinase n=1 Tax=Novosphingobium sp. TaxID=1874826 RepID=UPI00263877BB|nr:ATP-binding protein [Novosphingobium sp.]